MPTYGVAMLAGPVCETGCDGIIFWLLVVLGVLAAVMLATVVCTALAISATLQRRTQLRRAAAGTIGLAAAIAAWALFAVTVVSVARHGTAEVFVLPLPAMIGAVVWWRVARRQLREAHGSMN